MSLPSLIPYLYMSLVVSSQALQLALSLSTDHWEEESGQGLIKGKVLFCWKAAVEQKVKPIFVLFVVSPVLFCNN